MSDGITMTIGCDLGDLRSDLYLLPEDDSKPSRAKIDTRRGAFEAYFGAVQRSRVVIEAGTHSGWVAEILTGLGHEVLVANPRRLRLIAESNTKSDQRDAELLARLGKADPKLLSPVTLRSQSTYRDLMVIRSRDALVRCRTLLVNTIRGLVKAAGERLPTCAPEGLPKKRAVVPEALRPALDPLFNQVEELSKQIALLDEVIEKLAETKYPETKLLTPIAGVGTLTALAFVLTLEDPKRFSRSRQVGAHLGLRPKQRQSGVRNPELRISKSGDDYLRRLLVGSANHILRRNGAESDLRSWGMGLAARGGKAAKSRAKVAVARKLAVLMHRLWTTGEVYEPVGYRQVKGAA